MFYREEKKSKPVKIPVLKNLDAIESAKALLKTTKRQQLISQIKEKLAYQATHYQKFAAPLIEAIANYYQSLPETSLYFGHRGGLLDRALSRTESALQLMRQLMRHDDTNLPTEEQRIWLYALFSAGLLQGIGKLYTEYEISMYNENGLLVKKWEPLLEAPEEAGTYYNYTFIREDSDSERLRKHINILLAQRLMPKEGFALLASHPTIFVAWLALLEEDRDGAGPLDAILDRANAITLQTYLSDFIDANKHVLEQSPARMGTFMDNNPEQTLVREQVVGAEFLLWLRDALTNGTLILNQPGLRAEVYPNGVVLTPEVYDMYIQEHAKVKNKVLIQRGLNTWKHHELMNKNMKATQLSKIRIDNAILPETVKIYNNKTTNNTTVRTLDLLHDMEAYSRDYERTPIQLPELDTSGQWKQPDEQPQYHIKPGTIPGG